MSHRVRGIRQGNDVVWLRILRQQSYRGLARSPNVTLRLLLHLGHDCSSYSA